MTLTISRIISIDQSPWQPNYANFIKLSGSLYNTALLWQKEESDKIEISCKIARNVSVISTDVNGIS